MKRPAGVTLIAILGFAGAAALALAGLQLCLGASMPWRMSRGPAGVMAGGNGMRAGVGLLAVAAVLIIASAGLLFLQNWARLLTVAVTAIGLILSALGLFDALEHMRMIFFFGVLVRHVVVVAIDVGILVYLFHPDVRRAFGLGAASPTA